MRPTATVNSSSASYCLGIDVGTTFTAAAIARADGTVEMLGLGTRAPTMPSVVLVRADGEILVGEPAERRAATEPARVAREFKRRLGDPNPIFIGGSPYSAEALTTHLLKAVVERAVEREGGLPARTVVTHPASWSPFKIDLLRDALRGAGLHDALLMTEPEAAAVHYRASQRLAPGETVAVYDFGGGTFDAAVLAATADGYELMGTPEGIERLGGVDFDQAVLGFVNNALGGAIADLDPADAESASALAQLRDSCRAAKEALSEDTDATVTVHLPGRAATQLRLTRADFEGLIAPRVDETLDVLQRTIESAGSTPEEITRILAVGGSSRIPLVHQRVRDSTGRPLSFDSDPNLAIARGAAVLAHRAEAQSQAAPVSATLPPLPPPTSAPPLPAVPPGSSGPTPTSERAPATSARSKRPLIVAAAVAAIGIGAVVAIGGDHQAAAPSTASTTIAVGPSSSAEVTTPTEPAVPSSTALALSEVTTVSVPVGDGRTATFGGTMYTVESLTVGNGIDDRGEPAFDDAAIDVGATTVRVDLVMENLTDGLLAWDQTPLLRLVDDPVEVEGVLIDYDSTVFDSGGGGRASFTFVLPDKVAAEATAVAGSTLLLSEGNLVGEGIALDGAVRVAEPPVTTQLDAVVLLGGYADGTLTVQTVTPSLEAGGWLGSGSDEAGDYRAADGEVWLALEVQLDCAGGVREGCSFGLEQKALRIEVDGLAVGAATADWALNDLPNMTPGGSQQATLYLRVPAGADYALLLGDPSTPAAVQRVPLAIADDVAALYSAVAGFQT